MAIALFIISLVVLIISSYTDIQDGKIPNEVVLPAIGISLLLRIVNMFMGNITFWDLLFRLLLVVATFFFYEGFIGGGDAKIFMMLVIAQGPYKALSALALASLMVVAYSYYKDPKGYIESIKSQLLSILTKTEPVSKGEGKTVKLCPLMLIGFIVTIVIFGI